MSIAILSSKSMAELETAALAEGSSVHSLIQKAVLQSYQLFRELYSAQDHPKVALLVGTGHNACDALGIGCELLGEKRQVSALLAGSESQLKQETARMLALFRQMGGRLQACNTVSEVESCPSVGEFQSASVWIDGLLGAGLNRTVSGLYAKVIDFVNSLNKEIVALDIPSGISCDFGILATTHIQATRTFALGAYKPAHVDDRCAHALGHLHWIDTHLLKFRNKISAPNWSSLEPQQLMQLISSAQRKADSHKVSNGRVLVIAGSRRYPGAAVLACLGASVSGAGMIHALVPKESQRALLNCQPEIIFESGLPGLEKFDSIVIGPGWVPGDSALLQTVLDHVEKKPTTHLILDAGCFPFIATRLRQGGRLTANTALTPHTGEFSKLFPSISERIESNDPQFRINRLEAAAWAASLASAHIIFKGAKTHIADPDGSVKSIVRSSPLLAHAGQGDVFAGLLGGLCALTGEIKKAACLAALLQAEVALQFSSANPSALTLQPSELVRQLPKLRPTDH